MSNENYTDSSYSQYLAYNYTLLIKVEANEFSYAITSYNNLLASGMHCSLDELAHPKQLNELLSANYRKVIIGLPATGLSLVPQSLFPAEKAADYARFLDVTEDDKVFAQTLDKHNHIVYKTPGYIASAVERFGFPNTVYAGRGWINAINQNYKSESNLYVEVASENVSLLYQAGGVLRFYNCFECRSEDELVYFTSLVAAELNLSPQLTTIVLSGNILPDDNKMKRLSEFFPYIELNNIRILNSPSQIPAHSMVSLAALSLCE